MPSLDNLQLVIFKILELVKPVRQDKSNGYLSPVSEFANKALLLVKSYFPMRLDNFLVFAAPILIQSSSSKLYDREEYLNIIINK